MTPAALDWLLPGAPPGERRDVQRLVTLLRLLVDEGRGRPAEDVATGWLPARAELSEVDRRERADLLADLLAHTLAELRGPESFLSLEEPRVPWRLAWRRLLADGLDLSPVQPGETARRVSARLVEALEGVDPGGPLSALWGQRRRHLVQGPTEALPGWRELAGHRAPPRERAAFLAGELSCLLELGRVREAGARLTELGPRLGLSAVLARRALWIHVLLGQEGAARRRLPATCAGRLPAPLAELRERLPHLAPYLPGLVATPTGRAPSPADPAEAGRSPGPAELRRRFGAHTVSLLGTSGVQELEAADSERGRRRARASLLRADRDGSTEDRALRTGAVIIDHVLVPGRPRTRAVVPVVPAAQGAPRWWLLEWDHLLAPARAQLAERVESTVPIPYTAVREGRSSGCTVPGGRAGAKARGVAAGWASSLGLGLSRRRLFVLGPAAGEGGRVLVHEEGGALADWRGDPGTEGALARAGALGRGVSFGDEGRGSGLHRASRAGLWVPLLEHGRDAGLVGLESLRPGDALAGPEREAQFQALAAGLSAATFRDAHVGLHGVDVHHDPGALVWGARATELRTLLAGDGPVLVRGPGRRGFARWLAFRRGGEPREEFRGGEVLVAGRGAIEAQEVFVLPPLARRRDELPALLRVLVAREAGRAGRPTPRLSGDLLVLAFRQTFAGGLGELAEVAAALVEIAAGRPPDRALAEEDLARVLGARGPLVHRLPSRHPQRHDLEAALRLTAHRRGSWNKRRAARLLGWNPETLRVRLGELGLREGAPDTGAGPSRADQGKEEGGASRVPD